MNSEQAADLGNLRGNRFQAHQDVRFAHADQGMRARVQTLESDSVRGKTVFTLTLALAEPGRGILQEMRVNNYGPDEIAELRARLILLNERMQHGRHDDLSFVWTHVQGLDDGNRVEHGVFPQLWQQLQLPAKDFIPRARLVAAYWLKVTGTVEDILRLRLGPITNRSVKVDFRGRRHKPYANVDAKEMAFSGSCRLT